ncbi:hypothetical protein BGX26_011020 [Mortierella sp. AD094]|nr:hypothetical protein BGX26_011020 [Mortierella sp. AD094]
MSPILQQQRHHRRSVDRIWPPALEVKLAHWSREDAQNSSQDENTNDDHKRNHCQHFRGHWTPDGRSTWSKSHIIPAPPPWERQDSGQYMSDYDLHYATSINMADQESNLDLRHHQQMRRTFSAGQLSNLTGTRYPKSNVTIQYKRQCKTPTPIYDGNSTPHSPYTFSVIRPTETLVPLIENQEGNNAKDKNEGKNNTNNNQQHLYKTTMIDYTPDTLSEISTPSSIPSALASAPSTSSWSLHFSRNSSVNSSPSISRRTSFVIESSPEIVMMMQDFLKQHSNGHIMYRRPINCSGICPDSSRSSPISTGFGDNNNSNYGSGNDDTSKGDDKDSDSALQSSVTITTKDDIDQHDLDKLEDDDRMLMLGLSPNPGEFDPEEVFITENQKNAGKHVADTPVFFNGFPLLRMTPIRD